MTNYERIMKEMTPEKMAVYMMCPYDAELIPARCLTEPGYRGGCKKCCEEWLAEEAEEDAEM